MNAAIGFVRRQAVRTVHSSRRLTLLVLMLLALAVSGFAVLLTQDPQIVYYPDKDIVSTPAEVCPGEKFTYPIVVAVEQGDAVARVTEGWCRAEDGICPNALQSAPVYFNFTAPYPVKTTATRTVPDELTPGEWQLRHCNETHSSGMIDVVCYQVVTTVKEDCP